MVRINMNFLAKRVCYWERGKQEVNICQTKEILKVFLILLSRNKSEDILKFIKRYSTKKL